MRLKWSEADVDDYQRNLLKLRCEGRFSVSVYQPAGIVKVTLP